MTTPSPYEPSPDAADRSPSVIYVMGAGRSGSTVLGVALGNCANVFYAGELEAWLRRSGVPNFPGATRTRFWDVVRQSVDGEDLFGDAAWRHLEYSLAWFRLHGWTHRRHLRPRYRETIARLYRAIASSAHVSHIVDTSHYPLRAHELQRTGGVDLYLIYLVRDPLSVAASFKRQDVTNPPKSVLATNAYLSLTHLLSTLVFVRHRADRRLLVRYEDFVAAPEATIRSILAWVGLGTTLPDLAGLRTGVPFQGNRVLQSEVIALQHHRSSSTPRSHGSRLTSLLQFPWSLVLSRLGPTVAPGATDNRTRTMDHRYRTTSPSPTGD
jgi:sulfotransferase family protein